MRILVTGGTGFAGSFLMERLLDDGHELFGLVHPSTSHQTLPNHPRFTAIEGDLLAMDSLQMALEVSRPKPSTTSPDRPHPASPGKNRP